MMPGQTRRSRPCQSKKTSKASCSFSTGMTLKFHSLRVRSILVVRLKLCTICFFRSWSLSAAADSRRSEERRAAYAARLLVDWDYDDRGVFGTLASVRGPRLATDLSASVVEMLCDEL